MNQLGISKASYYSCIKAREVDLYGSGRRLPARIGLSATTLNAAMRPVEAAIASVVQHFAG
jgi:hypothetical protein